MLHHPCRTSLPFPSQVAQVPSPMSPALRFSSLPAFQPAHLHSPNWACGCQGVPAPWPCLWRLQENMPRKDVPCAAQDGSVETGLAKLIPGWWNGAPRECQAQCSSKTDRRNAAHVVTEGNLGISQSTNPVQLDGAIHAAPPSAALISTDRNLSIGRARRGDGSLFPLQRFASL